MFCFKLVLNTLLIPVVLKGNPNSTGSLAFVYKGALVCFKSKI